MVLADVEPNGVVAMRLIGLPGIEEVAGAIIVMGVVVLQARIRRVLIQVEPPASGLAPGAIVMGLFELDRDLGGVIPQMPTGPSGAAHKNPLL